MLPLCWAWMRQPDAPSNSMQMWPRAREDSARQPISWFPCCPKTCARPVAKMLYGWFTLQWVIAKRRPAAIDALQKLNAGLKPGDWVVKVWSMNWYTQAGCA